MPLWVLLLGGGLAGAKWGPELVSWAKDKLAPSSEKSAKPDRPPYCDPDMTPDACADVTTLLQYVKNPAILAAAAASYEAQGHQRAAAALASRAASIVKGT